ncbi:TolB-like protein [Rhizobium sp. BK650]|nr:TolB-like protein [Rhizobium sp. BK650]
MKAFTIANVVFGREASFDPQNDPVVRIEAGRIRKALERYYLVAGQEDDVVITVPKGGYVPHFEYARDVPASTEPVNTWDNAQNAGYGGGEHSLRETHRPRSPSLLGTALAIVIALFLAFATLLSLLDTPTTALPPPSKPEVIIEYFAENKAAGTGSDIARGLRDDIIGQLTRFDDIVVVADPLRGEHAAADYALQGNVQLDGSKLRVAARLVRRIDGAVIWANNFDADLQAQNALAIQGNVARQVADALAQPYGAIFQTDIAMVARPAQSVNKGDDACALAYSSYHQTMTAQSHGAARECLQQATERFPDNAVFWALLSTVYVDEIRFRYALGMSLTSQALALASAAMERAVSLAPSNPRVLQAQMLVSFYSGDIDKALKAGTAAYAADSDNVEIAGEYGFRLAMSGKWQSGCELLKTALNRGVGTRSYYEVGMALCAFMKGDIQEAEQWSRRSDLDNPMHRLLFLSILGAAGKTGEAILQKDWLDSHAPALMANIRHELSLRLQRPEDQERFLNGLRASGLVVDLISAR